MRRHKCTPPALIAITSLRSFGTVNSERKGSLGPHRRDCAGDVGMAVGVSGDGERAVRLSYSALDSDSDSDPERKNAIQPNHDLHSPRFVSLRGCTSRIKGSIRE
jgi:hypothetical protein